MPVGPQHQIVTLGPVTRSLMEDRSIQKPGDADRLSNWTAAKEGDRIVNRPGIEEARAYRLDHNNPPNVLENSPAILDWPGGSSEIIDVKLHVFHGRKNIYLIPHAIKRGTQDDDILIYDARQMENSPGGILNYSWLNPITSVFGKRSASVQFARSLVLTFPGFRAIQIEDDVDQAVAHGLRVQQLQMIDRVETPYAVGDDPGPYDVAADAADSPLLSAFCVSHQNRLFVAGNPNDPQRVWYSNMDDPNGWPAANTFTVSDATSDITGLASAGPFLYVFTRREVYVLLDVGIPGEEQQVKLTKGIGCISHGSIQSVGRGVIFLSEGGHVYSLQGQAITDISDRRSRGIIHEEQCATGRITSYYNATDRRYVLMFADHGGQELRGFVNPNRVFTNRIFEYRLDRNSWFPWEIRLADADDDDPRPLWDAVTILDTDGGELVHGARPTPTADQLQRLWLETGISDETRDVHCAWLSAPVNLYDASSMRPRRAWVITSEVSAKSMTVDPVSDDDRLQQNNTITLLDRSPAYNGFDWADGTQYRGDKPLKRPVGLRDGSGVVAGPGAVGAATIPVTGKHVGLFLEVSCGDSGANVGGASLYAAQLEIVPKQRRSE